MVHEREGAGGGARGAGGMLEDVAHELQWQCWERSDDGCHRECSKRVSLDAALIYGHSTSDPFLPSDYIQTTGAYR